MKALLLCTLLAMPAAAAAAEAGPAQEPATAPEDAPQLTLRHAQMWNGPLVLAPTTQSGEGMRAVIDTKTGKLRAATPGELQAAQALAPSRATLGLQRATASSQIHRADGSVAAEVPPELINYSVVSIDGAGQAVFACVDGEHHDHDHAASAAREVK